MLDCQPVPAGSGAYVGTTWRFCGGEQGQVTVCAMWDESFLVLHRPFGVVMMLFEAAVQHVAPICYMCQLGSDVEDLSESFVLMFLCLLLEPPQIDEVTFKLRF